MAVSEKCAISLGSFMGLVKTYTGEKSCEITVNDFLENVETVATMAEWPDNIKIQVARAKLKGVALQFFSNNPTINVATKFEVVKKTMIDKFGAIAGPKESLAQIMHCKQLASEKVVDFSLRLEKLRKRINSDGCDGDKPNINDMLLKLIFLDGIHPSIRDKFVGRVPPKYEEVVTLASTVEEELLRIGPTKREVMVLDVPNTGSDNNALIKSLYEEVGQLKRKVFECETELQQYKGSEAEPYFAAPYDYGSVVYPSVPPYPPMVCVPNVGGYAVTPGGRGSFHENSYNGFTPTSYQTYGNSYPNLTPVGSLNYQPGSRPFRARSGSRRFPRAK